jgi:putative colanic acid biosysnthesis UDP-glucose lipid carrier transferase
MCLRTDATATSNRCPKHPVQAFEDFMSDGFTLEEYRLAPGPLCESADVAQRPKKLWSRQVAADIVGVFEALAVITGGMMPTALYSAAGAIEPNWPTVLQSALVAALIYRMYLTSKGMYDTARTHDFAVRPMQMLGALTFAIIAALSLSAPKTLDLTNLTIWFALWLAASMTGALLVRTIASDIMIAKTAEGRFDERIAVYGAGQIARRVHDHLLNPALGLRFVGVFDSRETPHRINAEGLVVAGGLDELVQACQEGRVDRIIIALPQIAERRVNDIARKFEDLSVHLHIVTHLSTDYVGATRSHHISHLGPVGLLDIKTKQHTGWAPVVKRTEDVLIGGMIALVITPLLPVIACAIKLDSPGPILFKQRRRGRNQRVFEVLKFRTMSVMEDGSQVRQATANDPRITMVGRFLRRTSLDELPQIWNVLVGDMSLVGPRPHALVHDEKFGALLEAYANRHQMKPGVTGLAQVRGYRGETLTTESIEGRVNHDLAYIRSWSLWLDLKIMIQTVFTVAIGHNAK